MPCSTCGSPLQRDSSGLLKCSICGLLYPRGQNKPLLKNYVKTQITPQEKIVEIDQDQTTFINRVCERLIPIADDYLPDTRKKLLAVQEECRRELIKVFNGKEPIEKWFNRTRTNLGLHTIDLTKILYTSLEGLKSEEAKALRNQYAQALQRITTAYNPPT